MTRVARSGVLGRATSLLALLAVLATAAPGVAIAADVADDPAEGPAPLEPAQEDEQPGEDLTDPLIPYQWYLETIRVPDAWELTRGSPDVTVAVIDTGVDLHHQDLQGAFWTDPLTGTFGYDHVRDTPSIYVSPEEDWHGSAIAGIIAGRADDGYGIAGIAPEVRIMVHRIYRSTSRDEAPSGADYDLAIEAMRMAAAAGADVLLLPWGGKDPSPALLATIDEVGVPVVAAAGNDGMALSATPGQARYPAVYRHPHLVTVAATDQQGALLVNDRVASNYGGRYVDIAAPGEDIVTLEANGRHNYFEGTSFAAPQVAAALALGRSFAPGLPASELVGTLSRTARTSTALLGRVTSSGVLDIAAYLRALEQPVCGGPLEASGFSDVTPGSTHAANIDCLVTYRLALGGGDGTFAPRASITRGQMATFLVRLLEAAGAKLPDTPPRIFADLEGATHGDSIDVLAELGIVAGVGDGRFDPDRSVTRGQMATFVVNTVRWLEDPSLGTPRDWFDDTPGTTHADNIITAREIGIALGTSEPRTFAPDRSMTREQMATFLARSLDALGRLGVTIEPLPGRP